MGGGGGGGGGVTRTGMGDTREVWYILVISGEGVTGSNKGLHGELQKDYMGGNGVTWGQQGVTWGGGG